MTFLSEPPRTLFHADLDEGLAAHAESLLVRQIGKAQSDPLTFDAWRHLPTTYLKCTEDQVLFPDWQQRQINAVRKAGVEVDVKVFESSHSLYLKFPQEIVKVVEEVASRSALQVG